MRKLSDCCSQLRRRINGDAALQGYCYQSRKVFCVTYYQTHGALLMGGLELALGG